MIQLKVLWNVRILFTLLSSTMSSPSSIYDQCSNYKKNVTLCLPFLGLASSSIYSTAFLYFYFIILAIFHIYFES